MQISKIDLSLIKHTSQITDTQKNASQNISNPFGVSFKGKIIQADVFESTAKTQFPTFKKWGESSKLLAGAIVGGINNFNSNFKARLNSVIAFGKKMTQNAASAIENIANTEITFDLEGFKDTVSNTFFPDNKYKVTNLLKHSVSELKGMLQEEMTAI